MNKTLRRWMVWPFTAPIRAYQRWISPFTPSMCRFRPTCSQYAIEAIDHRGLVVGGLLATWRILRCNPLTKGGWDPVPGTSEARYQRECQREQSSAHETCEHQEHEHDGGCEN